VDAEILQDIQPLFATIVVSIFARTSCAIDPPNQIRPTRTNEPRGFVNWSRVGSIRY
jgi:hypothetical protein